jgi:hypothetical protein
MVNQIVKIGALNWTEITWDLNVVIWLIHRLACLSAKKKSCGLDEIVQIGVFWIVLKPCISTLVGYMSHAKDTHIAMSF